MKKIAKTMMEWEKSYVGDGLYQWVSGDFMIRHTSDGGYDLFVWGVATSDFDSIVEAKEFAEEMFMKKSRRLFQRF